MSERAFVDSSIIVYAHDRSAGAKHEAARELLETLWEQRSGVISTQVLEEVYVNVRRLAKKPLSLRSARTLLEDYLSWDVMVIDGSSILEALECERRYRISFWDALVVQAANAGRASVLYSEDLNAGERYGSVLVVNPFAP